MVVKAGHLCPFGRAHRARVRPFVPFWLHPPPVSARVFGQHNFPGPVLTSEPPAAMDDEMFLDEAYLSIRWRSVPKILYAEWKGYATSAEFRAALLTGVRAMKERHVVAYVSDARRAKVVTPEDEQWGREVWLPMAVAAGLKRMAIVVAPSGLAKQEYESAATQMDAHGLSMRTFDSVAAATVWAQSGLSET